MQNDIIIYMGYGFVYLGGAGVLAFAGKQAVIQVKDFVLEVLPFARRLFDPNTLLAQWLEKNGHDPAQVDKVAELIADGLQQALEAVPLAERKKDA